MGPNPFMNDLSFRGLFHLLGWRSSIKLCTGYKFILNSTPQVVGKMTSMTNGQRHCHLSCHALNIAKYGRLGNVIMPWMTSFQLFKFAL